MHFLANFNRFTRSSFVNSPFLRHWKYPYLCFFKHLLIVSFDTSCWSPQSFWMSREEKVPIFSLKLTKLRITDLSSRSVNFLGRPFPNFLLSSFNSPSGFNECWYIDVLGYCGYCFNNSFSSTLNYWCIIRSSTETSSGIFWYFRLFLWLLLLLLLLSLFTRGFLFIIILLEEQ